MHEVRSSSHTHTTTGTHSTSSAAEPQVSTTGGATEVDASAHAGNVSNPSLRAGSTLYNAAGAPNIGGITLNFSAEDMAAALTSLQSKTQDAQLRTAKEGLEVSKKKRQDQHEKVMSKIKEWTKKCESAEGKSKIGKIFNWVSKIASFVAAAVATIALVAASVGTAGAASPLLAMAVIGLVGSAMSLASSVSQEFGGPALELSALTSMACKHLLQTFGVPEKLAQSISKVASSALVLTAAVASGFGAATIAMDPQLAGNLASGIAELGGADATTAAIIGVSFVMATGFATALFGGTSGISSTVAKGPALVMKAIPTAISAGANITSGSLSISSTVDQYHADLAQADRQKFSALMIKIQAQMEEDQEDIKKLVQEMQDGFSIVSKMIAAAGESRSQITSNMNRPTMA